MAKFRDRAHAGRVLADALAHYANDPDVVVLALPRGGVPVAFEVARALRVPWDVLLVRKLGVPQHAELAMGALAEGGVVVRNPLADEVPAEDVRRVIDEESAELRRRGEAYRGGRPPVETRGRTVIVVDDGMATGASMRAAVTALSALSVPKRIVVAVPTAPEGAHRGFTGVADEFVCPLPVRDFRAVGNVYRNFSQVSDPVVRGFLES